MKPLYSIVLIAFFSLWIRSIRRIRPFWGNPDLGIQKAATAHSAGTKKSSMDRHASVFYEYIKNTSSEDNIMKNKKTGINEWISKQQTMSFFTKFFGEESMSSIKQLKILESLKSILLTLSLFAPFVTLESFGNESPKVQYIENARASILLKKDGSVITQGDPEYGGDSSAVASQLSSEVVKVFSTLHSFCALKRNGSVVTWGDKHRPWDVKYPSPTVASNSQVE